MSISVTVNGNPISLTRGRMVACVQDTEFDRRRKIRLQQVRQQSKEIAAEVRNRVKQVKSKQLSNIEHQTEKDLRKYKEKNLHTLKKQIDDCNREIGAAHKNAALEKDPVEVLNEISKKNDKTAHERMKIAVENKTKQEQERKNKLERLKKQRQFTKDVEKTRANLVVAINKQSNPPKPNRSSKKRKKQNNNESINSDIENVSSSTLLRKRSRSPIKQKNSAIKEKSEIFDTIQIVDDDEKEKHVKIDTKSFKSSSKESTEVDVECPQKDNESPTSSEKHKSRKSREDDDDLISEDETSCPCCSPLPHDREMLHPTSPPTKCPSHFSSTSSESSKKEIHKLISEHRPIESYKTTKISDRIRQRSDQLIQAVDLEPMKLIPEHKRKSTNLYDTKKLQMKNIQIVDIPSAKEKSKLPYVPQTTLKSKLVITDSQPQSAKAKYYDHKTHYSKTYIPPASVQKLDKHCVEVDTSIESTENANFFKHLYSQEKKAKIRGDKALKRAQVQNDYKQLMEELPVLQRQERLAAMRNHNPEFHMTDERLHEMERRRQNRIENIFEKYYQKSKTLETPIITIRPVQKPVPDDEMKLPFTALDVSEDFNNIGQWKSENPSQSSKVATGLRQVDSNRKSGSSHSGNRFQFVDSKPASAKTSESRGIDDGERQKCLAELLQRLNKQRELLLQEIQNLPPTSNLQKILQDETLIHLTDDSLPKTKFISASDSSEPIKKIKSKKDIKKRQVNGTSSETTEEKQKKRPKPKERKQKVVKNDEGTQTSPNIITNVQPKSVKASPRKEKAAPKKDQETITIKEDDDKLCEIIIKMCDDSKVKICTHPIGAPPELEKIPPPQKQVTCDISSSTSYLSPPVICPNNQNINVKFNTEYKDALYGKPKQTNIDTYAKRDAHVKTHNISKPKQKSAKSHIPTKIINPQLLNYIKKLLSMSRKSIDDLTISSASEISSPSPNVVLSQHNNPFLQLQNVMNYYNLTFADIQNELNVSSKSSSSDKNISNTNAEMEQLDGDTNTSPTSDDVDYSEILSKYQEVTRTCVNKISTLTLMIDKIRAEKETILSPISVDLNENSMTSYLDLPPNNNQKGDGTNQEIRSLSTSAGSNKSQSLTQEEIDRYFLEIGTPKKDTNKTETSFVPMLQGIPKYNKDQIINEINIINPKPRPPASLAQNMQRYNLNIDMTPHELSTIVELDTAVTSKNISEQRPKTPDDQIPIKDSDSVEESTSNSGFITISPEQDTSPKEQQRKTPRSKYTNTNTNTSSSSPENFEEILRTMGLGWAVSTLKKTQEALALSSSSSSDSIRKHSFNTTSISDITLKEVLNREFLKKLTSSSSSDSPTLQDISDIVSGALAPNKDRSTQRTSTPVHQSKSTDSKTNLFASVSDISSVRQLSDENMFLSIPDISLDTNRSLNK